MVQIHVKDAALRSGAPADHRPLCLVQGVSSYDIRVRAAGGAAAGARKGNGRHARAHASLLRYAIVNRPLLLYNRSLLLLNRSFCSLIGLFCVRNNGGMRMSTKKPKLPPSLSFLPSLWPSTLSRIVYVCMYVCM